MGNRQGEVWWGPAPHKSSPSYRPWLVVSRQSHPFSHAECIGLAMTTQEHADGIAVPDDAGVHGGSQVDAYISPWYATTIKLRDLDNQQGELREDVIEAAIGDLHEYTALSDG